MTDARVPQGAVRGSALPRPAQAYLQRLPAVLADMRRLVATLDPVVAACIAEYERRVGLEGGLTALSGADLALHLREVSTAYERLVKAQTQTVRAVSELTRLDSHLQGLPESRHEVFHRLDRASEAELQAIVREAAGPLLAALAGRIADWLGGELPADQVLTVEARGRVVAGVRAMGGA